MPKKLSLLALGDSYTIGESVQQSESWPFVLKQMVDASKHTQLQPTVIAQTGWTTSNLIEAIRKKSLNREFDLVSLLIGVNNQYQNLPLEDFKTDYLELLELALKYARQIPENVLVMTIPDWSVSPFANDKDGDKISEHIDQFNAMIRRVCDTFGIGCIDITKTSRKALGSDHYFASDKLHFSVDMHKLWAEKLYNIKFNSGSTPTMDTANLKKVTELDYSDPLKKFRNDFINDPNLIYLDGNSLGKLPKATLKRNKQLVEEEWGKSLIRGWNKGWIDLSGKIAAKIAQLIGAQPDEVFVGDTTSLNLYKLLFAGLTLKKDKSKIVSDSLNFPSDLYVLQGLLKTHFPKHTLTMVKSTDGIAMEPEVLEKEIDKDLALLTLSHVTYKSSFLYDMEKINTLAHQHNALVIWDLSHAVGAVPIDLNASGADMAVGCTYKYLNGGPGAPAFLYVSKKLQKGLVNPIWSWFSHEKPFAFDPIYKASESIEKFAVSTPGVLSLAAVECGIDIFLAAGMEAVRKKSIAQSELLIAYIQQLLVPYGFTIASPLDAEKRGSHIAIRHPEGYRICSAMIKPENGKPVIIPDFRPPDLIRLGISPLYNSYTDIYKTVQRIKEIVSLKQYENYDDKQLKVP